MSDSNRKPIELDDNELPSPAEIKARAEAEAAKATAPGQETEEDWGTPAETLTDEAKRAAIKAQAQGLTTGGDIATGPATSAPGEDVDLDNAVRGARGAPAKAKKEKKVKGAAKVAAVKGSLVEGTVSEITLAGTKLDKSQGERVTRARINLADAIERGEPGKPLLINPECVLIAGLDFPSGVEDPLYQPERNALPVDERTILYTMVVGFAECEPIGAIVRDGVAVAVDGRQTLKTFREANKRLREGKQPEMKVGLVVMEHVGEDNQLALAEGLNAHRTDDTPMTKARAAGKLMQRYKDVQTVATVLKLTPQGARDLIQANEMPSDICKIVDKGDISVAAALHVVRKIEDPKRQVTLIKDAVESGMVSVAQVKGIVNRELGEGEEEGENGSAPGASPLKWQVGSKPKLRFLKKVVDRALENPPESAADQAMLDVVVKALLWAAEGKSAPMILSGHVKAVNNSLDK